MSEEVAPIRPVFERTLEDLRDDADRKKSALDRSVVDALYQRRGITPEEAIAMEKALAAVGVEIADPDDDEEVSSDAAPAMHDSALGFMMRRARLQPLLTREEEIVCGRAIQLAMTLRDDEVEGHAVRIREAAERARTKLVVRNVRLAVKFAFQARYRNRLDVEDLVQMGLIGVMTAAEKFDPEWGTKFSTYATWWIMQAMSRGVANEGATIRVPVHMVGAISAFRRTARRHEASGVGKDVLIRRVAETLGWEVEKAAKVATFAERRTISIDEPLGSDERSTIRDSLVDQASGPEEIAIDEDETAWLSGLVGGLTGKDERLAEIVRRRFGFEGVESTLEEIGNDYGVTRERIRQLEIKALRILARRAAPARDA